MAIVENFYNGDMARSIRETLTKNFANIARYIPNNFISLTSMERQNLPDDYKTHFKLVFDKEQEYVYRWSEVERNWRQYLIRAKDEYARAEADTNTERAFADAEIGIDIDGTENPYVITFYNRKGTAKDSVFLNALNIKYNEDYSVQTIIDKIISDFNSLDNFVGDRDIFLNNADITATTITGALNEINQKTLDNKLKVDNILDGTTVVPKADHANEADHALNADMAEDSKKLGGQLPSYYATQEGLDNTNDILTNTISRVEKNENDIASLQQGLANTDKNLADVTDKVQQHDTKLDTLSEQQANLTVDLEKVSGTLDDLIDRVGWEVILPDTPVTPTVSCVFKIGENYSGKTLSLPTDTYTTEDLIREVYNLCSQIQNPTIDLVGFGNECKIECSCPKAIGIAGTPNDPDEEKTCSIGFVDSRARAVSDLMLSATFKINDSTSPAVITIVDSNRKDIVLPEDLLDCSVFDDREVVLDLTNKIVISDTKEPENPDAPVEPVRVRGLISGNSYAGKVMTVDVVDLNELKSTIVANDSSGLVSSFEGGYDFVLSSYEELSDGRKRYEISYSYQVTHTALFECIEELDGTDSITIGNVTLREDLQPCVGFQDESGDKGKILNNIVTFTPTE